MSDLNVQVEELSPVVRRLRIDVSADRVSRITDGVYRQLGQTVKLAGFRQGHVPRRVLEKYFADRVRTDVAREVVQKTFPEALGTTQLSPVSEPTLEPEELRPGEGFRYSARVEVRPDVTLTEYKGLEVTVPQHVVSDADVEARLNELRESHADLVPLEGRDEVVMGDFANVDYEIEVAGRKPQKSEGGLIRVEPGSFLAGAGEKLVGQKVGETREITESLPGDRSDELGGKEARIKVTVTGLKQRKVPAADDDFARDARGLDTLDALRKELREDLERRAADELKGATRAALMDRLIEKNPIEVPPALVDSSAERLAVEVVRKFSQRGLELPGGSDLVERLKKEAMPRAIIDVKSFFLLDAVAKAEAIEATAEEAEKKLEEMAEEESQPLAKIKARYRTPQSFAALLGIIRGDKAFAVVEGAARITVVPEAAHPESKESGAES
jgi:trigger factor